MGVGPGDLTTDNVTFWGYDEVP